MKLKSLIILFCSLSSLMAQLPSGEYAASKTVTGLYQCAYMAPGLNSYLARDYVVLKAGSIGSCSGKSTVIKTDYTIASYIEPADYYNGTGSTIAIDSYVSANQSYNIKNGPVAFIQGAASVQPFGAASYALPIDLPAGPNNLRPNISIVYNSLSGDGKLGWGWDLVGISSVYRVSRTPYHNGKVGSIELTNNDALALDGLRLIKNSGSNSYILESDNLSNVTSVSPTSVNDIAKSFSVTDKDGNVAKFGEDNVSTVTPISSSIPIAWKINSFKDVNGNEIKYYYENLNGENQVTKITYVTNGNTPTYQVLFKYTQNPVPGINYITNGQYTQQSVLLKSILVLCNNKFVREYTFDYNKDVQYFRLVKISEKDGFAQINPTIINWKASPSLAVQPQIISSTYIGGSNKEVFTGDFNGDGIKDILTRLGGGYIQGFPNIDLPSQYNDLQVYYGNSNGDGGFSPTSSRYNGLPDGGYNNFLQFPLGPTKILVTDIDNDGKTEITYPEMYLLPPYLGQDDKAYTSIASYNADQSAQHVVQVPASVTAFELPQSHIDLDGDNGTYKHKFINAYGYGTSVITGDFNGDANIDYLYLHPVINTGDNNTCHNAVSNINRMCGTDFLYPLITNASIDFDGLQGYNTYVPFDLDGDGKSEILKIKVKDQEYYNYIETSKVIGINDQAKVYDLSGMENLAPFNENKAIYPLFGDFNGDGKQDFLGYYYYRRNGGFDYYNPKIYINTGGNYASSSGFTESALTFVRNDASSPNGYPIPNEENEYKDIHNEWNKSGNETTRLKIYTGDFNGDGKTDLLYIDKVSGNYILRIGYSTGNTFSVVSQSITIGDFEKYMATIDDFNNDGKSDILILDNTGKAVVFYINKDDTGNDLLVSSVSNGMGHVSEYTYSKSINNNGTYSNPPMVSSPLRKFTPTWLVSQMKVPDGLGGFITTKYKYEGGILHLAGKGFLGFQKFDQTTTNAVSTSRIETDFGYNGSYFIPYPSSIKQYYSDGSNTTPVLRATTIPTRLFQITNAPNLPNSVFQYVSDDVTTNAVNGTIISTHNDFELTSRLNISFGDLKSTTQNIAGTESYIKSTSNQYFDAQVNGINSRRLLSQTTYSEFPGADGISNTVTFTQGKYDTKGRPTEVVYDNGVTETLTYNTFGDIASRNTQFTATDGLKTKTINYSYSTDGRFLLSETINSELTTSYTYDDIRGSLLSKTLPNGLLNAYSYDILDRISGKTDETGNLTTYSYDWSSTDGLYKQTIHAPNNPTNATAYFDLFGQDVKSTADDWNGTIISSKQYDALGRLTYNTLPCFISEAVTDYTQTYSYAPDGTQRIGSVMDRTNSHAYNYNGLKSSYTAPGRTDATYELTNAAGLLAEAKDIGGKIVTFDYHSSGQLSYIYPFNDIAYQTTIEYDNWGRRISYKDKNMATGPNVKIGYTYNPDGSIATQTDPNGKVSSYIYDNYGRLTQRSVTGEESVTYNYNTATHSAPLSLASMELSGSRKQTVVYGYDPYGRANKTTRTVETDTKTFTLENQLTYDSYDNVVGRRYASGLTLSYNYNSQGTLVSIMNGSTEIWSLVSAKADGLITKANYGSTQVNFNYKAPFNTPSYLTRKTVGSQIEQGIYSVDFDDAKGNVNNRTFYCGSQETFTYDDQDRLKTWLNGSATYYDNGNLNIKSNVGTYNYDASVLYRLNNIDKNTSSPLDTNELICEYTSFNKIKKITQSGKEADFVYGPDQQRILMQDGTHIIIYGDDYEAWVDAKGNIIKEWTYVYAPTGLIGIYYNNNGAKNFYYIYTDHLGSPVLITNSDGSELEVIKYDAWGSRYNDCGETSYAITEDNSILRRGFTMHEHLDDFGLINMNGRLYDPVLGRMIQADPVVPEVNSTQSYNGYSYVYNNPLKYTDPDGECPFCVALLINAAVNVGVAAASGNIHDGWDVLSYAVTGQSSQVWRSGDYITGTLGIVANVAGAAVGAGASASIATTAAVKGITNLTLRAAVVGAVGGAAGGGSGGALAAAFQGQSSGAIIKAGLIGAGTGLVLGFVGGAVMAKYQAYKASKSPPVAETEPLNYEGIKEITNKAIQGSDDYYYHYTFKKNAPSILQDGLTVTKSRQYVYVTTKNNLTPMQAQIELALSPNRGLVNTMYRINISKLNSAGINPIIGPRAVTGGNFGAGGGTEVIFNQSIPPSFIEKNW